MRSLGQPGEGQMLMTWPSFCCAERWQKPDPQHPGQTIAQSVMDQYGFRQGVNQIWIGVGVVFAWIIALVAGTIVCLTYLDGTLSCCLGQQCFG